MSTTIFTRMLRTATFPTRPERIIIPSHFNTLLRIPWVRTHLYHLGCELFKLETYRKFQFMLMYGGGGQIKCTIHDLLPFIKRESLNESSVAGEQMHDLLQTMAQSIDAVDNQAHVSVTHKYPLYRWIFISIGYIASFDTGVDVGLFVDKLLEIYIEANKSRINLKPRKITDPVDAEVLSMLRNYFSTVEVDYDRLYSKKPRSLVLTPTCDQEIDLPPLPRIRDKSLLVKGLMHRENYRALLRETHPFGQRLTELGYDLSPKNYNVLKYELSFFDGLGDFYLAREASALLYALYEKTKLPGGTMRCHLYQMIRLILSTNTLLAKLTYAYGLQLGLKDPVLNQVVRDEFVPNYGLSAIDPQSDTRVYEEEFLGDYFEAYVGALYWEQPDIAHDFVSAIYHNIIKAITKTLPPDISYSNWTWNIMGRSLVDRQTYG
ncbi:hypothetical protein DICA1_F43814 [Diutina catenulata]